MSACYHRTKQKFPDKFCFKSPDMFYGSPLTGFVD